MPNAGKPLEALTLDDFDIATRQMDHRPQETAIAPENPGNGYFMPRGRVFVYIKSSV
jgi:hypothetical protein